MVYKVLLLKRFSITIYITTATFSEQKSLIHNAKLDFFSYDAYVDDIDSRCNVGVCPCDNILFIMNDKLIEFSNA